MKILLIRHAEPDYPNNTLTEKGFREAKLLTDKLKEMNVSEIYSSPLNRAMLTASPLADAINQEIQVEEWLQEFTGKILNENGKKRIPWNLMPRVWSSDPLLYDHATWLQSSLMNSVDVPSKCQEVTDGVDRLLQRHGYLREGVIYRCGENRDKTIALFCHFGVGMVIASHLTAISPVLLWQSMFLPTSSVTTFVTEERVKGEVVFKCMQMGDTSHLYAAREAVSKSGLYPEFFGGEGCGPQV